jgi:hypothetical protein
MKAQDANGCKSRPGNCRHIPVATQTLGEGDLPAEALGKKCKLLGCSNLAGRNAREP